MADPTQKKPLKILGISCFYHDSAAALLVDGRIIAAAQEERFTRVKHDDGYPKNAVAYCLKEGGIDVNDLDHVVFYDKPLVKFERLLETYIKVWPRGLRSFIMAMRSWLKQKLWTESVISKELNYEGDILFTEHHYAHAASAYYASDFDDAVVVTMDGVGEWDTASIGYGTSNHLELTHTITFPDSLGLLYSALTYYLGFKVNSAEYKVMGLAPYGNPDVYYEHMKKLITLAEDGSFKLNMDYFSFEHGLTMTNKKCSALLGGPPRGMEEPLEQRHKDIAAALQKITEEIVLKVVAYAKSLYNSDNLCMAGGVALNCVANGKILQTGLFKNIYIQPAAGDAGGAVGAACYVYFDVLGNAKVPGVMRTVYTGPAFSPDDVRNIFDHKLKKMYPELIYHEYDDATLIRRTAELLRDNGVVGWFQGRMEFGPRALGNRSILADARKKENWQRVNLKIKYRESFRPFAPSVLEEKATDYFDVRGVPSPYMLLVGPVKRATIPAVTHVDGSARIQTVNRKQNKRYYDLISAFEKETGCPVIINTSFNVRGEPIVCTPEDAFNCFVNTEIDHLVIGNIMVSKKDNPVLAEKRDVRAYLREFQLD